MSIEKNPNSPLAHALGFKSKLAQSDGEVWDYAQKLYGSLLKNGGASLLITCFICMLCVLGQTELVISIAGGVLFALEVVFYLGLHWYCQSKLKKAFEKPNTIVEEEKTPVESQKQVSQQGKLEKKTALKVTPVSQNRNSERVSPLSPSQPTSSMDQEGGTESLDATRRLVFDPVPTMVKPSSLSRASKHQALNIPIEPEDKASNEETKVISTLQETIPASSLELNQSNENPALDDLESNAPIENLVSDYKTHPVSLKPLKVQEETQVGPSFHVLSPAQPLELKTEEDLQESNPVEEIIEPNFEEEDLEEGIVSQQFFHHPVDRSPEIKEDFIADTVIFHDPQEPQPIYHRATAQTKDSVEIPPEFFEQQADKNNCLKRSQKAKGSSNPIPPDPESAFRYRRLAASLRGETLPKD
ncbi:MAG: hypothetical protein K2H85_00135 [Allobaculum sp.]|nr:hypothetical protein [Allobaculum sp.]